jgi:hypothetical protein
VQRDLRYNPKSFWLSILLGFHVGTSTYCWHRNSSTFTISKTGSEVARVTLFGFTPGVDLWATFLLPHLAGVCKIHSPAWVRLLHVSGWKILAQCQTQGSSISSCFMVAQTVLYSVITVWEYCTELVTHVHCTVCECVYCTVCGHGGHCAL